MMDIYKQVLKTEENRKIGSIYQRITN